jgi:hypothetical protein
LWFSKIEITICGHATDYSDGLLVKKAGEIELYKKISAAEDEVRELTREKRRLEDRVEELERALKLKNTMKFKAPFYYQEGDGVPFCHACCEKDGRAVHLVKNDEAEWYCNVCKTFYDGGPAFAIA